MEIASIKTYFLTFNSFTIKKLRNYKSGFREILDLLRIFINGDAILNELESIKTQ